MTSIFELDDTMIFTHNVWIDKLQENKTIEIPENTQCIITHVDKRYFFHGYNMPHPVEGKIAHILLIELFKKAVAPVEMEFDLLTEEPITILLQPQDNHYYFKPSKKLTIAPLSNLVKVNVADLGQKMLSKEIDSPLVLGSGQPLVIEDFDTRDVIAQLIARGQADFNALNTMFKASLPRSHRFKFTIKGDLFREPRILNPLNAMQGQPIIAKLFIWASESITIEVIENKFILEEISLKAFADLDKTALNYPRIGTKREFTSKDLLIVRDIDPKKFLEARQNGKKPDDKAIEQLTRDLLADGRMVKLSCDGSFQMLVRDIAGNKRVIIAAERDYSLEVVAAPEEGTQRDCIRNNCLIAAISHVLHWALPSDHNSSDSDDSDSKED